MRKRLALGGVGWNTHCVLRLACASLCQVYPVRGASPQFPARASSNRVLFTLHRIGSVNCEQRLAIATTRTTRNGISRNGWSSRPRPVNRLQATSQPRRVMRGGVKGVSLAPNNEGQTRAGKAIAFTKQRSYQNMNHRQKQYRKYLRSEHWLNLKAQKLLLNPVCEVCGTDKLIQVHHCQYKPKWEDSTVSDLKTLCKKHHRQSHGLGYEEGRISFKQALDLADNGEPPAFVNREEFGPNITRLISVCWHLSEQGTKEFFISVRDAAKALRPEYPFSAKPLFFAAAVLNRLVMDSMLSMTEKGSRGRATRYVFVNNPSPTPD